MINRITNDDAIGFYFFDGTTVKSNAHRGDGYAMEMTSDPTLIM